MTWDDEGLTGDLATVVLLCSDSDIENFSDLTLSTRLTFFGCDDFDAADSLSWNWT